MSEQSEEKALQRGYEFAISALADQREKIASLSPADRLHWWLGFLSAAIGAALASAGEPVVRALRCVLVEEQGSGTSTPRAQYAGSGIRLRRKKTYIKGAVTRIKKKA